MGTLLLATALCLYGLDDGSIWRGKRQPKEPAPSSQATGTSGLPTADTFDDPEPSSTPWRPRTKAQLKKTSAPRQEVAPPAPEVVNAKWVEPILEPPEIETGIDPADLPELPEPIAPVIKLKNQSIKIEPVPTSMRIEPAEEHETNVGSVPKNSEGNHLRVISTDAPADAPVTIQQSPITDGQPPANHPTETVIQPAPFEPVYINRGDQVECLPMISPVSNWSLSSRSLLLSWNQPDTTLLASPAGIAVASNVYDWNQRYAHEITLERRVDTANGMELTALMTEDASRSVGVGGVGLAFPTTGVGADAFANGSAWSSNSSSRLWSLAWDFTEHYMHRADSPIRGRIMAGPRFIGLRETYGASLQRNDGIARYDTLVEDTLFGANAGLGLTLQPAGSPLSLDIWGKYGVFGNVYELRNQLDRPDGTIAGSGLAKSSRFSTSAEVSAEAALQLHPSVRFFAGYRLWNIQGVGRALSQFPDDISTGVFRMSSNGNLFSHGVYAGCTIFWGGAADPNSRFGGAVPYVVRSQ